MQIILSLAHSMTSSRCNESPSFQAREILGFPEYCAQKIDCPATDDQSRHAHDVGGVFRIANRN